MSKSLLLGAGRFGSNIFRTLKSLGQTPFYVCDLDHNVVNREPFKSAIENKETGWRSDYRQVLDKVDVVYLATPAKSHYTISTDILNAGKDLFCEKPLALTVQETKNLITLAQNNQVVLQSDLTFLFDTKTLWLAGQDLGNVISCSSTRCNWGPFDTGVNVIFDLCVHCSSLSYFLFGLPESVQTFSSLDPFTNDIEEATIFFRYKNFDFKSVVSRKSLYKTRLLEIHSNNGSYILDYVKNEIYHSNDNQTPKKISSLDNLPSPLEIELSQFIDILEGREGAIDLGMYYDIAKMIDAANKSAGSGKEEYID